MVAFGDAHGPATGAAMLAARSTGEHGGRLADIAGRWLPPKPAEAPVASEVERLGRLGPWLAGVRNALRSVGAPAAP